MIIYYSHLDLYLKHDINGTFTTKLCDKRDDFNFPIVNYPFLDSNIPSSPAYGVYMSQLIRYSRTCNSYRGFLHRYVLLTKKLFWSLPSFDTPVSCLSDHHG